jgi:hypothetical protein
MSNFSEYFLVQTVSLHLVSRSCVVVANVNILNVIMLNVVAPLKQRGNVSLRMHFNPETYWQIKEPLKDDFYGHEEQRQDSKMK